MPIEPEEKPDSNSMAEDNASSSEHINNYSSKSRRQASEGSAATSSPHEQPMNSATAIGASTQSTPVKGAAAHHHSSPSRPPSHYFPPMPHLAYTMAAPPQGHYYPRQGGWYGGPPPPYPGRGYPHYDPSSSEHPPGYYPPHYQPPYGHYSMQHNMSGGSPDESSPSKSNADFNAGKGVGERAAASSSSPSRQPNLVQGNTYPPPPQSRESEGAEDEYVQDVDPMRHDFHFYLKDHKDTAMGQAKQKILEILRQNDKDATEESIDQLLVLTFVNERIKQQWEKESKETRDKYRVIEESDRARFMQEDEIASRHCATLTARAEKKFGGKSSPNKSEVDEEEEDSETNNDHLQENGDPSPHLKRESNGEEDSSSPVKKMRDMTNIDDDSKEMTNI
mmetsp:Transcript_4946/g.7294  ORF Transcript_4946/g.7294 Transcript_4946/m.7294 type:complete len:393 (-) Transcript_4946:312-1490(-)|eukprot:CAMPEP_0172425146 /NCGR_PEP_ID=MMETSP1064-20121228/30470_1 /TAXON_ID=202472 /ORGANISM="Aulacoseira subarctica , Strain CCAP 1002/5" /LENGTH=392 /DNA_ID=CAMNT_0013167799 /DNA_START=131 /DNA_END=1309 /DNA_ORIENTATION=-